MLLTEQEIVELPDDPEVAFFQILNDRRTRRESVFMGSQTLFDINTVEIANAFIVQFGLKFGKHNYTSYSDLISDVDRFVFNRALRKKFGGPSTGGVCVALSIGDKDSIRRYITKIRKVVAVLEVNDRKRDAIYARITDLEREVDQSKTRTEAAMGLLLEVSSTLGEAATKLEPVTNLVKKVVEIFADAKSANDPLLIGSEERKALPAPKAADAE